MNGQDPNQMNNNLNGTTLGATSLGGVNANPQPQVDSMSAQTPQAQPTMQAQPTVSATVDVNQASALAGVQNSAGMSQAMPDASALGGVPNTNMNQTAQAVNPAVGATGQPVAQPIPGTESLTGNTVASGGTVNAGGGNANAYVEGRKPENIGVVPPPLSENDKKKKKPFNKVLFIILIVVLIAAIAFGLYYFLVLSNSTTTSTTVTAQDRTFEVGSTLPTEASYYANGDTTGCTPIVSEVDATVIGEYTYSIMCDGEIVSSAKIVIADLTAPDVSLNIVFRSVGETVLVDDFVESCTDPSNCSYEFSNESVVTGYLSTAGGPYDVEIIAKDTAGNTTTYIANLYVTPYSIVAYANYTSSEESLTDYEATKVVTDILPMGYDTTNTLVYLGISLRKYTYTFASEEEYSSVVGDKDSTITFDDVTGYAKYDDGAYTLTIITDLSIDTLNEENGGSFPTNYSDFYALYVSKGYSSANKTSLD